MFIGPWEFADKYMIWEAYVPVGSASTSSTYARRSLVSSVFTPKMHAKIVAP
jgi:hypothetical protein